MALTARLLGSFPVLVLATAVTAQNYVTFEGSGAEALFRQSRNAIGGEAAVMNTTGLVMKGTVVVSAGDDGPASRAIEMRVMLPDQYVRIETSGAWAKRSGFSGKMLLTEIRNGSEIDRPPVTMTAPLLRAERGRLARLLLGVGSLATPEIWLTLRQPMGVKELGSAFETGRTTNVSSARVLEASARDGFAATAHYDAAGVPLRVEYEANRRRIVTTFADRRKVGTLMLPHKITTTLDGMPLEEITLTEITLNPALTKDDFQIVR